MTSAARTFELAQGPGRIPSMEGLRGFAVLLVFCVHVHSLFGGYLGIGSAAFQVSEAFGIVGQSGVDLFFILSGYLIYGRLIAKSEGYGRFLKRRLQRVYPAFACVLAIYLALHFTWFPIAQVPTGAGPAALYILQNAALLPGLFDIPPLFAIAWSLSYEIFFYAAMPLVVAAFALRRRSPAVRTLFFLAIAICFVTLHMLYADWTIATIRLQPFVHTRLLLFLPGIWIWELQHSSWSARQRGINDRWTVALVLAGSATCVLLETDPWMVANVRTGIARAGVLSMSLGALVLACFTGAGMLQRIFSWTPLRWLGNMSYSYYLIHGLVLHTLLAAAPVPAGRSPWTFAALIVAGLPATLLASAALFICVEKPLSLRHSAAYRRGAALK